MFVKGSEVFYGDGRTLFSAEGSTFFVGGHACHLQPPAVSTPFCGVCVMPSFKGGEPAADGFAGDRAGMFTDEGNEKYR